MAEKRSTLLSSSALLGAFIAIAGGFAPQASAEGLADAVALAYQTNPGLRAERERARSVDENIAQARAGFLPTVTVTGEMGKGTTESNSSFLPGVPGATTKRDTEAQTVSAQAIQPIFRGGRSFYGFQQATAAAKAAHALYRSAEQQFLLDVVGAYMDVRRDEATVGIRENNVTVLRTTLQAAKDRFDVGEGTKTDIAQAEARLSGADAGLAAARAQLDASRSAYERIVGQKPGTLDPEPPAPNLPLTVDDAINVALVENPDLLAADLSADAARYNVGATRGALLPEVSLIGQASKSDDSSFIGSRQEASSVFGRVTIPLFEAGLYRSQLRQAKIDRYRADAIAEDSQNRVVEAVTAAWSRLLATRAIAAASKAQVQANEIAFEGVQREQEVGLRTALDVLDAEQELLDSRLAAVNADRDAYVAAHQLLATTGGLEVEIFNAGVGSYQPEKYMYKARRSLIGAVAPLSKKDD